MLRKRLRSAALVLTAMLASGGQAKDIVVTLSGDMIGPYRSLDGLADPGFDAVMALFREADVGFANQEGAIFDLAGFAGFPAAENGGGYPLSPAVVARQLRAHGINLVSKANNHGTDWGAHGLIATLATLAEADIVQAGAGADPQAACAPAARGTVALVSAATTFPPMSRPVTPVQRRGQTSRAGPGICAIQVQQVGLATGEQLDTLRALAGPLALAAGPDGRDVRLGDQIFRRAEAPGRRWEMKPDDLERVMAALRTNQPAGTLRLFAVHAHETDGTRDAMAPGDFEPLILHRANEAPDADNPVPADYVPRLMHGAIDAGADMAVRTGPHSLGGIELYMGKPIFYSLGSLIFDFGGRRNYTAPGGQTITLPEGWYETVVPRLLYRNGTLAEIRLYPARIDPDAGPGGGLPHRATGAVATAILTRLQALSRPFGTSLHIEGDVGVIRPNYGLARNQK